MFEIKKVEGGIVACSISRLKTYELIITSSNLASDDQFLSRFAITASGFFPTFWKIYQEINENFVNFYPDLAMGSQWISGVLVLFYLISFRNSCRLRRFINKIKKIGCNSRSSAYVKPIDSLTNLLLNFDNLNVYISPTERVLLSLQSRPRRKHKVWNAEVWHVVVDGFKGYSDGHIYHSGIICSMGKPYSIQKEAAPQAISCVHFFSVRSSSNHRAITSFPAISAPGEFQEIVTRQKSKSG